ncbi:MAG TPA: hypothetical protein VF395_10600, partial [Polyangiaceae bacterium]
MNHGVRQAVFGHMASGARDKDSDAATIAYMSRPLATRFRRFPRDRGRLVRRRVLGGSVARWSSALLFVVAPLGCGAQGGNTGTSSGGAPAGVGGFIAGAAANGAGANAVSGGTSAAAGGSAGAAGASAAGGGGIGGGAGPTTGGAAGTSGGTSAGGSAG